VLLTAGKPDRENHFEKKIDKILLELRAECNEKRAEETNTINEPNLKKKRKPIKIKKRGEESSDEGSG